MKRQIIELGGREISYTIVPSKRARHPFIRVDAQMGLTLVKPCGMSLQNIPEIMQCKSSWILKKLDKYNAAACRAGRPIRDGGTADLLGSSYRIKTVVTGHQRSRVVREAGSINIFISEKGSDSPSGLLKIWYKDMAREIIVRQVQKHAAKMAVQYNRISIRDQKTRWGSCSGRKNLSFNWRIIMAPLEVLDYLVLHELCHLIELNHSKKFWAHLADVCPDFMERKRWLSAEGLRLRMQI